MKLKMTVVGTADMIVDLPLGSEEMLHSIEYDLPREFEDFLSDLGIHDLGEVDFLNQLRSLEVESFKAETDDSPADPSGDGSVPEGEVPR